jgi:hypothetical protein
MGFFSVSSYTSSALKHKPEREATIMQALFVLTEGCMLQRRVEFLEPHRAEHSPSKWQQKYRDGSSNTRITLTITSRQNTAKALT